MALVPEERGKRNSIFFGGKREDEVPLRLNSPPGNDDRLEA
jgi:hypothetical protein